MPEQVFGRLTCAASLLGALGDVGLSRSECGFVATLAHPQRPSSLHDHCLECMLHVSVYHRELRCSITRYLTCTSTLGKQLGRSLGRNCRDVQI
jgi:hypothetical protein